MDRLTKIMLILVIISLFLAVYLTGWNLGYMFGYYESHLDVIQYYNITSN